MSTVTAPRVLVRFRPSFGRESKQKCADVISADSVQFLGSDSPNTIFNYDGAYDNKSSQNDVFSACMPVVESFLESYNGTIMAYGQTGSGKTHSLFGTMEQPGLVPQVITTLLQRLEQMRDDTPECTFILSFNIVEIYCERIRDLLDITKDNLGIKDDKEKGMYLQDASEYQVKSAQQALKRVHAALNKRAVSATNMNAVSSRSHCMVYMMLNKRWADGRSQHSKLCLVDLAGSERQDKTGAEGITLDEAKLINKSLSCLGNVVKALTEGSNHVPYRESKLTRVLQDSLGGCAKVVILICCSPVMENAAETLSSLRFGLRAKGMQNIAQVSFVRGGGPNNVNSLLASSRQEADRLRAENDDMQTQLKHLQEQLQQLQEAASQTDTIAAARKIPLVAGDGVTSVGKQGKVTGMRRNVAVLAVTGVVQLLLLAGYFVLEDGNRAQAAMCL